MIAGESPNSGEIPCASFDAEGSGFRATPRVAGPWDARTARQRRAWGARGASRAVQERARRVANWRMTLLISLDKQLGGLPRGDTLRGEICLRGDARESPGLGNTAPEK